MVERPADWPAIYKVGAETPKIILSNSSKAVITVTPISNHVIREGNVYYILCGGADESDKPASGVSEGSISFVLVRKDGYTSIEPFDNDSRLYDKVMKQCASMVNAKTITQEDAKLVLEVAANIQSGNTEGYKKEPTQDDTYAKWNVVKEDGAY